MKLIAKSPAVFGLLYASPAALDPTDACASKTPRPKAKPALKKLLLLAFFLLAAGASYAQQAVTCNGKEFKTDAQERIWENKGGTWTQVGDRCLNLVCSRRNLYCYGHENTLWRYNGRVHDWTPASELHAGQQLNAGFTDEGAQNLTSADGKVFLYVQVNGDIGIWAHRPDAKPVWSSQTAPKRNCTLKMQTDGNLVMYDASNRAVWSSQTHYTIDQRYNQEQYKPVRLVLNNDGRAELLSATGFKAWDSKDGRTALN